MTRRNDLTASLNSSRVIEDPYGMELLSSVHWVMAHEPAARGNAEDAIDSGSQLEPT